MENGLIGFDDIEIFGVFEKFVVVKVISVQIFDWLWLIVQVMCYGFSDDEIGYVIVFDLWFLFCLCEIVDVEVGVIVNGLFVDLDGLCCLKMMGFIDVCLVKLLQ